MRNWGIFILWSLSVPVWGQSFEDLALLFSRQNPQHSARVMGMGGVQIGVGGDFSNAAANPAGLAFFNRGEIAGGVSSSTFSSIGLFEGQNTKAGITRLAIPSLGFVFKHGSNDRGLVSGTFAITLSRMNDFNQIQKYSGRHKGNSLTDFFADRSYGIDPDEFINGSEYNSLEGLAYNNFLTEEMGGTNPIEYFSVVGVLPEDPSDVPEMNQEETIDYKGTQSQWTASYAANFNDVFFVGASLHLRNLKFESIKRYKESDFYFESEPSFDPLDNFILSEEIVLSGSGVAATLGAMVRPVDWLRLGISYNTPTSFTINDSYLASIKSVWNVEVVPGQNTFNASSDEIISDYRLKTPGKLSGGMAFFFNKRGFFSLEGDLVSYGKAKYKPITEDLEFNSNNESIKDLYKTSASLRAGGELRFQNWRVRGGYGFQSNPFKDGQTDFSQAVQSYSVGGGYRTSEYYVDAALTLAQGQNGYRPYTLNSVNDPLVKFSNTRTLVNITVGFLLN